MPPWTEARAAHITGLHSIDGSYEEKKMAKKQNPRRTHHHVASAPAATVCPG